MSLELAQRVLDVGTETAFEVLKRAKALEAQGRSIIHLEIGEPDFDTPDHIREGGIAAIRNGDTHYGPSPGQPALRQAIAQHTLATLGLEYDPESVVVTSGAKPIILFTLLACVDPDMEVIYPDPGFPIYESAIRLIGARPVPLRLREKDGFALDPAELASLITDRTKLLILNSPHNPTGSVLGHEILREVARLAIKHGFWVLSDEVYDRIVFDGWQHASIAQIPGMQDQTVIMNGHSKAYAMTGWRLGYGVMPLALAAKMARLNTNSVSHADKIAQAAGLVALTGPQNCVTEMVGQFSLRRDAIVRGLNDIPGVTCRMPLGAFYAFPNVSGVTDYCKSLADALLEEAGVACLPGTCFGQGGDGCLRFSFANSVENIEKAMRRFRNYLGV